MGRVYSGAGEDFNPRSPRGERRAAQMERGETPQFQSTLPARGATCRRGNSCKIGRDFNPRSPRGERPWELINTSVVPAISIHAPREGSDICRTDSRQDRHKISIHAPREGSDIAFSCRASPAWHFNPRSPRGERRNGQDLCGVRGCISIHAPREGSD